MKIDGQAMEPTNDTVDLRVSLGITKEHYARLLSVSLPTLKKMEEGEATPRTPAVVLVKKLRPFVDELLLSGMARESVLSQVEDMLNPGNNMLERLRRRKEMLEFNVSQPEAQSTRVGSRTPFDILSEKECKELKAAVTKWYCPAFYLTKRARRTHEVFGWYTNTNGLSVETGVRNHPVAVAMFLEPDVSRSHQNALEKLRKLNKGNISLLIICRSMSDAIRETVKSEIQQRGDVLVFELRSLDAGGYADFARDLCEDIPSDMLDKSAGLLTFQNRPGKECDFALATFTKDIITLDMEVRVQPVPEVHRAPQPKPAFA